MLADAAKKRESTAALPSTVVEPPKVNSKEPLATTTVTPDDLSLSLRTKDACLIPSTTPFSPVLVQTLVEKILTPPTPNSTQIAQK